MSLTRRRPNEKQIFLVPCVKVWLETDGHYAFGFGIAAILQAVDQAGSIKQAAADLGKSYRYVWGRIKRAEQTLGQRLVVTHVGGKDTQRSSLSPYARQLAASFLRLRARMARLVEQEFSREQI
jgi:molybdate transport system regulatory protein